MREYLVDHMHCKPVASTAGKKPAKKCFISLVIIHKAINEAYTGMKLTHIHTHSLHTRCLYTLSVHTVYTLYTHYVCVYVYMCVQT